MVMKLICSAISLFASVIAQPSGFKELANYDLKIETLRQQNAAELSNPYHWAELGELYFNRHQRWKLGGLIDSLDCFTWATDLLTSQDDNDARRSALFAMTLQKGIILGALGRSMAAIAELDTAIRLSSDSPVDMAAALYQKAEVLINSPNVFNSKTASLLLLKSFQLNGCDFDTYYRYVVSLKATNAMSKGEWRDLHEKGELILTELTTEGSNLKMKCLNDQQERVNLQRRQSEEKLERDSSITRSNISVGSVSLLESEGFLHWSLYLTADMMGDIEVAWRHLSKAHELDGADIDYDLSGKVRQVKQITAHFKDGYWPPPSFGMGSSSRIPVFIVGFFRSGSTLLETMLDAHKEVWGMGEESVFGYNLFRMEREMMEAAVTITDAQASTTRTIVLDDSSRSVKSTTIYGPSTPQQGPVPPQGGTNGPGFSVDTDGEGRQPHSTESPYRRVVNQRANIVLETMLDRMNEAKGTNVSKMHHGTGVKRIVDKMLSNYKNIALIHLLFPHAVILHTVRDPMDTLFSCYKSRFSQDSAVWAHDVSSLVSEYVSYLEVMQHFRRELPRGRVVDVSYESLIASPESVMRRIVTGGGRDGQGQGGGWGLGLVWDPMVMRHTEHNRSVRTASVLQVSQAVYSDSVGGWRKYQHQLQPLIAKLSQHLPRLRALNALPSLTLFSPLGTASIDRNWSLDPDFDYSGLLRTVRGFHDPKLLHNLPPPSPSLSLSSPSSSPSPSPSPSPPISPVFHLNSSLTDSSSLIPPIPRCNMSAVSQSITAASRALTVFIAKSSSDDLLSQYLNLNELLESGRYQFMLKEYQDISAPQAGGVEDMLSALTSLSARSRVLVSLMGQGGGAGGRGEEGARRALKDIQVALLIFNRIKMLCGCVGSDSRAGVHREHLGDPRGGRAASELLLYTAEAQILFGYNYSDRCHMGGGDDVNSPGTTQDHGLGDGDRDPMLSESSVVQVCPYSDPESLLRKALTLDPSNCSLYSVLTSVLKHRGAGDADWAVLSAEVTRVLESDELRGCDLASEAAHTMHTQHTTGGDKVGTCDPGDAGSKVQRDRAELYWGLFSACDAMNASQCAPSLAWQHLLAAHAIEGDNIASLAHSQLTAQQVRYIKSAYNRDSGFWPTDARGAPLLGSRSRAPVFIVGFPGCGSALLENMLGAHKDVWGMGGDSALAAFVPSVSEQLSRLVSETQVAQRNQRRRKTKKKRDKDDLEATQSIIQKLKDVVEWHGGAVLSTMKRRGRQIQNIMRGGNGTQTLEGGKRIVDKMLSNYKNIAHIHLLFPHAVILHTVRDPMDTLFSCYKSRFSQDSAVWAHDVSSLVSEYVSYLEVMQHFRRELPRGRVVDVSYESLIASPESVMRRIVTGGGRDGQGQGGGGREGLGLVWDPMVMRHTQHARTDSLNSWKKYQHQLQPLRDELDRRIQALTMPGHSVAS